MYIERAGKQIRILRAKIGMSQEKLAEDLDVSPNFLSNIERCRKPASLDFYIRAANYFKVTLDYLFYESIEQKDSIIIDSIALKLRQMKESEQRYILDVVDVFSKYSETEE